MFEYQHRASNAQEVWARITKRLGKDVHSYAPRVHTEKQGVYAVRETLRALTSLMNEVHIEYLPLFSTKSVYYAFTERLCLNELYAHALFIRVYKKVDGYLHIIVAEQGALENILPLLESSGIQSFHRVLQKPTQKVLTNSLYTMVDYEKVYEPKTASWKVPDVKNVLSGK